MTHRPATSETAGGPALAKFHPWTTLLLQAQAGEAPAFGQLVEQAEKPVFGFVHRKVRDLHGAQDIVAETFMKAWRTLPQYKPERCQGNTWLFMIARRLVIDHLRKKGRRKESLLGSESAEEQLVDPAQDATERHDEQQHRAAIVRRALDRLPPRYAEALDLMYLQELDRHEVAMVLGCSVNAVSTVLTRARDRLQEELKNEEL